jgi:hypothetical protein
MLKKSIKNINRLIRFSFYAIFEILHAQDYDIRTKK